MAQRADPLPTEILVEDDDDIARLVQHHLMTAGSSTRWFRTASRVTAEAEKQTPALFLLDLMLPGTDGFHLCRGSRRQGSLGKLPVSILTARTGHRDRALAFESGWYGRFDVASPRLAQTPTLNLFATIAVSELQESE